MKHVICCQKMIQIMNDLVNSDETYRMLAVIIENGKKTVRLKSLSKHLLHIFSPLLAQSSHSDSYCKKNKALICVANNLYSCETNQFSVFEILTKILHFRLPLRPDLSALLYKYS